MKVRERIDMLKNEIETKFGLDLTIIQIQKELSKYHIEKFKAFAEIEIEIKSVINSQVLNQWLLDNEIPENDWEDYAYINGVLLFRNEEVELDG